MSPPNPVNGVISFLRADTAVAARVAGRVYGPDGVPASENAAMPRDAIVVSPAGGLGAFGRAYQDYGDRRIDVACFARTKHASHELYLDVFAALKHMRRAVASASVGQDVLLHWARLSAGPTTSRDPETEWPMTLSSWQVLVSEIPA